MSRSKKAALDAGTIESGLEKQKTGQASGSPDGESITGEKSFQGRIEAMLPRGERNAVCSKDLMSVLGLANTRQLREAINFERMHGALILSTVRNRGGYFLPSPGEAGRREIAAFIRTVNARAVNSQRIRRTARQALTVLDGQLEMEGEN